MIVNSLLHELGSLREDTELLPSASTQHYTLIILAINLLMLGIEHQTVL